MHPSVPFNRPAPVGRELDHVAEALRRQHLSGDGDFTRRCHAILEQELGVARALLTTSCTHALEMTALLLELEEGDEVILPSFTFVSTANAFALRGATPVFVDIRPDTLNLDETLLENAITPRTKAIVVVHYAGVACEMDEIGRIAGAHGVAVIEDNAHGLFGRYKGRPLGTFGALSTLSFHETKNFTCGEGGALLINDASYVHRAEIIREKGTDRSRFLRGEVSKYVWRDIGSSFLPSEILAAFLWGQLEQRDFVQRRRRELWVRYATALAPWAAANNVRLPVVPEHVEQPFHLFHLLFENEAARVAAAQRLKEQSIAAVTHYVPLHDSPAGRRFGRTHGDCAVTTDVASRLLRLPFFTMMTDEEQERVIEVVTR